MDCKYLKYPKNIYDFFVCVFVYLSSSIKRVLLSTGCLLFHCFWDNIPAYHNFHFWREKHPNNICWLWNLLRKTNLTLRMKVILTGAMFLFVIYQNAARSQVFRYYIENTDLVDKIVGTLLGVEKGPMPFIDCAIKCNRCCACFGFNSLTKKCRIHQSCDVSNVSGDGAGWRYYVFNKLGE